MKLNTNSIYYHHLEEYFNIKKIAINNIDSNPNVTIESCKALFEGVSKYIIFQLDETVTKEELNADNIDGLITTCMKKLSLDKDEVKFYSQSIKMIGQIRDLRNERAEISHGTLQPIEPSSNKYLAKLVFDMTMAILDYIVNVFMDKASNVIRHKNEYKNNKEFNKYLDGENNYMFEDLKEGIPKLDLCYSKLLFENDYDSYIEDFENWKSEQDQR